MQNSLLAGGGGDVLLGGSVSTLSREDSSTMVMSSEESSSYQDESELELGLGLSLGGGCGGRGKNKPPVAAAGGNYWDQYARILTAKDFPSVVSTEISPLSSSCSSVTKANTNGSSGTKRTAESPCSPPGHSSISQVVGWPPVRTYRLNSLTNHAKSTVTEEFFSNADKCKSKNIVLEETNHGASRNNKIAKEKGLLKTSLFVKVNMDGIPIGRKVDLNAHSCYETLACALHDMFTPNAAVGPIRPNMEEQAVPAGTRQIVRLLDSSSDLVLTYEDKEGDWMLVGDVPWEIFLDSVRRLRIMRTTDANGLAPESQERNRRQSKAPI